MQSAPSTSSPTGSLETTTTEPLPYRQHGLSTHEEPSAFPSPSGGGQTNERIAIDASFAASLSDRGATGGEEHGQRLKSTPSPPLGGSRIAEYENASTPPVRKREGPGFEVIKKPRSAGDKRSPIQDLPNEILTHALAHLAPVDLTSIALVSKRFHDLVIGPHAWRSAFAHFFPGADSVDAKLQEDVEEEGQQVVRSEKRVFTRLTALASWRSEYIMRTRLLRSLGRGKPVQALVSTGSARTGQSHTATPHIDYPAQLLTTINHLHATFGSGNNKRLPRFIHGADDIGTATSSDPKEGKVDNWGVSDPQTFLQFFERFPGDAQYGLGPGDVVGVPNVMDVSQPYGMVHGEGSPGGLVYFRSSEELRGRFLTFSSAMSSPEIGIPRIASTHEAMTSVWIAKSAAIQLLTEGLIGILSGSSLGVLTAYSLGSTANGNHREQRFGRGEMTARWVLSPGVPIIAIAVDNEYSLKRQAQNRIWAVVLNAMGEVFYLTKFPTRSHVDRVIKLNDESIERLAWLTGRSVYWKLAEPSRRVARIDPYADSRVDGSYSPRSSWTGMCLNSQQIQAETREIEDFAVRKPSFFRKACLGWDMRRKLEVDFAGDDGSNAGENIIVFQCGLEEDAVAAVTRYARCRFQERPGYETASTPPLTASSTEASSSPSVFGGGGSPILAPAPSFTFDSLEDTLSQDDFHGPSTPRPISEEWRKSVFSLHGLKHVQILATTIDKSLFAIQTLSEDPLLSFSGNSASSSPTSTPASGAGHFPKSTDMPGQRARFVAAGTQSGSVLVWDIRASPPKTAEVVQTIEPIRIIHTESPEISCLAMTSLYLVHGGNDGLVQAWDLLGSRFHPIRTMHSARSSRARRQIVQAQASVHGVGINLFAAGAICLDPDPTVLRGMVSLGVRLRYWSYSSSAADQYKSQKRRLRRSERGSNNGGERFSGVTRGNLKDYIANERFELDREKDQRKKEAQRFAGRFGTSLLDGSEDELLAYAAMLSQETLEQENRRRASDTSTVTSTAISSTEQSTHATGNATPIESPSPRMSSPKTDEEVDADIAEAIRLSLATSPGSSVFDIPIRRAKPKGRKGSSAQPSPRVSPFLAGNSRANEMNDLDFALQLSLAEEQSKQEHVEEFPALSSSIPQSAGVWGAKGKGKMG
nr:f-box/wd repeat-containing protein pof10 [Quercus suber]